jgi:hypothetical protein
LRAYNLVEQIPRSALRVYHSKLLFVATIDLCLTRASALLFAQHLIATKTNVKSCIDFFTCPAVVVASLLHSQTGCFWV